MAISRHPTSIRVLERDPDLGDRLSDDSLVEARRRVIAEVRTLEEGEWTPTTPSPTEAAAHLGVLVIDGLLARSVIVGGRPCAELLGAGDVLRPWTKGDESWLTTAPAHWTVLEGSRIAVLDRRFLARVAPWPEIVTTLFERSVERARMLAFQMAIGQTPRVDARLLMLFSQFANRWGRISPEGVIVPLRLTHEWLGQMVGAQRPTVTTALQRLSQRNALMRRPDGTWLLRETVLR